MSLKITTLKKKPKFSVQYLHNITISSTTYKSVFRSYERLKD